MNKDQDLNNNINQNTQEKNASGPFHKLGESYKYIGRTIDGSKQGFGIQTWKDEAQYKGLFMNNQANGLGKFIHSDGDVYSGEFICDRAFGFGIYTHFNGANYMGQWCDDAQEVIRNYLLDIEIRNRNLAGRFDLQRLLL